MLARRGFQKTKVARLAEVQRTVAVAAHGECFSGKQTKSCNSNVWSMKFAQGLAEQQGSNANIIYQLFKTSKMTWSSPVGSYFSHMDAGSMLDPRCRRAQRSASNTLAGRVVPIRNVHNWEMSREEPTTSKFALQNPIWIMCFWQTRGFTNQKIPFIRSKNCQHRF